jgi:small subunit ribosomal protein S2
MATKQVDIKELLESGAHFGHKTERWHPKMAPYIHSKRGGSHIIDLTKTVDGLETALDFIANTVAAGKPVLMVGTKRQAQSIVLDLANSTKQPFVVNRWLGGMLTNWPTVSTQIKRLKDLESKMASGELTGKYNKLEVQRFQEEIDHKNHLYGGIKDMPARPGAVFVIDVNHDINAIREARKLNVPVVALVDTNADPTLADYIIPCNDDAIKTLQLIADYVKEAVEAGQAKKAKSEPAKDKTE